MHARLRSPFLPTLLLLALPLLVWCVRDLAGQTPGPALTILSRDSRRTLPLVTSGAQDLIALDDLATAFQATFREEAGALTITYRGRTIILTPDQTLASVAGRVISLPSPPTRVNGRWVAPLDIISRALSGIYDARLELRRPSRLVIVGDLRVPRLTVRHETAGAGARVTIESFPRSTATITREPDYLLIRFDADALDLTLPQGQIAGFVQAYRVIDATAIAIDLGPRAGGFRNSIEVADSASTLVLDVLPQELGPAPPTTTPVDPAPALSGPELPSLSAASGFRTIVIDPGHGGDDRGSVGPTGISEKDVTLALARRLRAVIEARLGTRVLLTRDDDRPVPISSRTALANNNKADLFVSLHANGGWRPDAAGATIYVASFAEGEVDPKLMSPERLPAFGGGFRDIELVPWNLAQARHRNQSEALATLLSETFRERIPLTAIPLDRAPLRVLEAANMPAVLIETGFLTNPTQEQQLARPEFQGHLAQAIVDAIVRYRGGTPGEAP